MFAWLFLSIFYKSIYFYGTHNSSLMSDFNTSNTESWFIYFPNQVYLLQFIFYLSYTISIIVCYKADLKQASENIVHLGNKRSELSLITLATVSESKQDDEEIESNIPKVLIYFLWAAYTIIFSLSCAVTVLFFFNEISNRFNLNNTKSFLDIWLILNVNVFNSIIMTIDFLFTLIPLRLYHFYLPIIYSILYILIGINIEDSSNTEWLIRVLLIPVVFLIHIFGSLMHRMKFSFFSKILNVNIVTFE